METIIYSCDGNYCENQTHDIKLNNWVEIGSDNNTLFINNHLKQRRLISLSRHTTIHFCSSKCLTEFFVSDNEQE